MDRKERINKFISGITAIAVLMITLLVFAPVSAFAEEDISVENSDDLVLEVITDDTETLMDKGVPLAAAPVDNEYVQHAVLGGILLAMCLAYVIFFSLYQKKIFALRREVAQAENRVMRS